MGKIIQLEVGDGHAFDVYRADPHSEARGGRLVVMQEAFARDQYMSAPSAMPMRRAATSPRRRRSTTVSNAAPPSTTTRRRGACARIACPRRLRPHHARHRIHHHRFAHAWPCRHPWLLRWWLGGLAGRVPARCRCRGLLLPFRYRQAICRNAALPGDHAFCRARPADFGLRSRQLPRRAPRCARHMSTRPSMASTTGIDR